MAYGHRRLLAWTVMTLVLLPTRGTWAEAIGQIKAVSGEVTLVRNQGSAPAQVGALVEQTDVLVTGADGRVGMTFIDNTRFSVGPNSQVALEKFTFNPTTREGEFLTKIERGAMSVISGHIAHSDPEAMKVKTRTTILGVRGTHFLVQVKE